VEILREFTFEAAHRLPNVPAGAQVRPAARPFLPGGESTFRASRTRPPGGCWTSAISPGAFQPLHDQARSPLTSTRWPAWTTRPARSWPRIWRRLAGALPLSAVVVRETCTCGCITAGEDGRPDADQEPGQPSPGERARSLSPAPPPGRSRRRYGTADLRQRMLSAEALQLPGFPCARLSRRFRHRVPAAADHEASARDGRQYQAAARATGGLTTAPP